jgi:hypothetical protein
MRQRPIDKPQLRDASISQTELLISFLLLFFSSYSVRLFFASVLVLANADTVSNLLGKAVDELTFWFDLPAC